ncbi:LacI family DNA-binding transcriptional regulator [Oceanobacillus jeddahense]|uniref:LacI family DNA-binding transcriptional regulator n=1 Tax=Oceanobacillus jeddahense TaxID=1462527 RepID=UPI000595D3E8|nr:LacI family DNA-binding transcriptional regulator [Oceanobacillus jeddahense]
MRITMKEIAKEAGVSVTTVSHVINGSKKITEETYNRVMDIVNKYNYVPNYSAKNLRNNTTKTAGLIVPSFPDSFVTEYINAISLRAKEMNYNLLFVNTNEDVDYEEATLKLFSSQMVDGIILSPAASYSKPFPYHIHNIMKNLPIVLISRYHDALTDTPLVCQDDYQAGFDAAKHFLEHGHKKMVVVYGMDDIGPTFNRIKGFKAALELEGMTLDPEQIIDGEATVQGAEKAIKKLINNQTDVTAMFLLNDSMTIGAISALNDMNISIPNEMAIIGFGDFPSASIINRPITTISASAETMGRTAFDMLLNKINNPDYMNKVIVPTYLIKRKSCGC